MKLGIYLGCALALCAAPSFGAKSSPEWVWVAAVAPANQEAATLAIARAHIAAVMEGSHAVGYFVHPVDKARTIAVLKADAHRHHYSVDFGQPSRTTKKPSR